MAKVGVDRSNRRKIYNFADSSLNRNEVDRLVQTDLNRADKLGKTHLKHHLVTTTH